MGIRAIGMALVMVVGGVGVRGARAVSLFLNVPGITGENPVPGFPGAMGVSSLTVTADGFSVVKRVDSATVPIMLAESGGTHFSSIQALVYKGSPTALPDETLGLSDGLVSGYSVLGGTPAKEGVSFSTTTPAVMFLELPGITGESSTPGHAGVIQISSFTLENGDFSVIKPVDKASPAIASAIVSATVFPTASVLFYNSGTPVGPPDAVFGFDEVEGSSRQVVGNDQLSEEDTFAFITVPEPATGGILLGGAAGMMLKRRGKR